MTQRTKKSTTPSQHDPDFKAVLPALKRAAKRARETAMHAGTSLVLWQDGRVKTVRPGASSRNKGKS